MIVGSEDKTLYGFNTNFDKIIEIKSAHDEPIYALEFIDDNLIASGDDNGIIKIWDLRTSGVVYQVDDQKGSTTSDIKFDKNKNFMVSTNTGGTLGVYDLRKENNAKEKLYAMSDEMEEELNCLQICKVE